ncbi:hypothetical protein RDABS01_039078 [Bienertia sinuspersici]
MKNVKKVVGKKKGTSIKSGKDIARGKQSVKTDALSSVEAKNNNDSDESLHEPKEEEDNSEDDASEKKDHCVQHKVKKKVVLIKKVRKKKSEDEHYMIEIKSLLNVSENDPLTTLMLAGFIVNLKDGGHDFKRLLVLYVCSVLLAPTTNGHVDLFLTKVVANVDEAMMRRVYRSSICAANVLQELNEVRDDMLKKIESFKSNKMNIISMIINHKRKEAEARRENTKQAKAK